MAITKKYIYANSDLVTAGSTEDTWVFCQGFSEKADLGTSVVVVTVASGSGIKFSSVGPASLSNRTVLSTDSPVTMTSGLNEYGAILSYKATGADDTFKIEF